MTEIWAVALAAVGTAVSVAGTVYGAVSAGGVDFPKPKKFIPVDANALEFGGGKDAKGNPLPGALANDANLYAQADQRYQDENGPLVAARNATIADSFQQQTGASNQVTNALAKAGVATSKLTGNPFDQAHQLGKPILSLDMRDNAYFQKLLADNPMRQFGLSGSDAANIAIANTGSANNYNAGVFGERLATYNTQVANSANLTQGLTSGIGSVASSLGNAYLDYNYFHPHTDPTGAT